MRSKLILFLGGFLLIGISGCNRERIEVPEHVLEKDELIPILVDIHLIDSYINKQVTWSKQQKQDTAYMLYGSMLQNHEVRRLQFDTTILFYGQYPEYFNKMYDEVLAELSKMKEDNEKGAEPGEFEWDEE